MQRCLICNTCKTAYFTYNKWELGQLNKWLHLGILRLYKVIFIDIIIGLILIIPLLAFAVAMAF
jgi:hypothetical protein